MVEKTERVKYVILYRCDDCGEGSMMAVDQCATSGTFLHRCNKCNAEKTFDRVYPYTEYDYVRVR